MANPIRGMVLSFLVVGAVIATIMILAYRPAPPRIKAIDYGPALNSARATGAFPVAAPVSVPAGWQATSVRYVPSALDPKIATWHLGFITPTEQYAAVDQSNGSDPKFVKDATAQGRKAGIQQIGDTTWTQYEAASGGNRSLGSKTGPITTVVTGTLSYDQLAAFSQSLRAT